jgi:2-polyprenyl-3-methyl-5-hydroxy-6-metoxy-1,4-benzoquinol methylase
LTRFARLAGLYKRLAAGLVDPTTRIIGYDLLSQRRKRYIPFFLEGDVYTLDIGFGGASWVVLAAQRGNRVVGITPVEAEVRAGRAFVALHGVADRVELVQLGARRVGEMGNHFDQVFCMEVLEHIIDDDLVVRQIYEVLKPGGQLLVSVPTAEHPPTYGEGVVEVENGHGHVRWGYSKKELRALLESAGFEIAHLSGYGGFFTQKLLSLMRYLDHKWNVSRGVTFPLCYPLIALDGLLPYPKLSYFVVARRPEEDGGV